MKVSLIRVIALALPVVGTAWAVPTTAADLGASITVSDANYQSTPSYFTPTQVFSKWYANHEDNETETNPQTVMGQQWDLEGMYLSGDALTLVGGYDFRNGTPNPAKPSDIYRSGDIFIDVNGDVTFGYANNNASGKTGNVLNSFGYDYVVHFDSTLTSYSVFSIDNTATVTRITDVPSSNPWRYYGGGTALAGYQGVAIGAGDYGLLSQAVYSQLATYGSPSIGLAGYNGNNNHYYLTVDTSFLPSTAQATFHYTMECGNDNLMGTAAIARAPDSGSTAALLSLALVPLFARRRKAAGTPALTRGA